MAKKSGRAMCTIYISPEERSLLAKVAQRRGVGRDYLARFALRQPREYVGRPIPQWLAQTKALPASSRATRKPPAPPQARHCRSCVHVQSAGPERLTCAQGMWRQPLLPQSVHTSRRVRAIGLVCPHYAPRQQPPRATSPHCRTCRHLVEADTADVRYVCGRGLWTNPMKPLSVSNARRLKRMSATCPHFARRTRS